MWKRRASELQVPLQGADNASPKRRMPWRPVMATVVLLSGAFCLFRGISALQESATVPIPQQKSAANNYVKLDVPQPPLDNAFYFGRCTMTAVYAHWDYPLAPADPDEHWAQDISIELTVADPSSVPSHLTLILAGTATTPNGLGAAERPRQRCPAAAIAYLWSGCAALAGCLGCGAPWFRA